MPYHKSARGSVPPRIIRTEVPEPIMDDSALTGVVLPQNRQEEYDSDEVPDGAARKVLDWVGSDPERARRAIEAEEYRDSPRKGLMSHLKLISGS